MTFLVFAWGVSEACMAASKDHRGIYVTRYVPSFPYLSELLLIDRFFLGLFEAG
jgi:hypothetical protein